jgi:RecA-family ATPase
MPHAITAARIIESLCQNPPPILLEQGQGLVQLYAPCGLGKTYVALAAGLAVSGGRRLFIWDGRSPHGRLYIYSESPARTMRERFQKLVNALSQLTADLDNGTLITSGIQQLHMPDLATPEGRTAIEPYLKNMSLLIIDNIAILAASAEKTKASRDQRFSWR